MRLCRFNADRLGVVLDDQVVDVTAALDELPALRWPYPLGDQLIANWDRVAPRIAALARSGAKTPLSSVELLAPIANPSKVIGVARNRKNLAAEAIDPEVVGQPRVDGDPMHFFLKATSAVAGPSAGIALRFAPERRTDPEAELAIVIGRKGTDIAPADALDYVFGYTIGLDTSLRGPELPSARKSIDTYATMGPWVVTRDEIADPDNIASTLRISGVVAQEANTNLFCFDVRSIVANASAFFTLYPGDVILAGTPPQFKRIVPGDVVDVSFEGIGSMQIPVRSHR